MITLSGLQHVIACPGSALLPRPRWVSPAAALGTAIHELLQWEIDADVTEPVEALAARYGLSEDDAGRLAFLAGHMHVHIPHGALAEVPLGYWPDGSVRQVKGGAGRYEDDSQWLSGTIDAMWAEPHPLWDSPAPGREAVKFNCDPDSTLWVVDWKSGDDEHVTPIDRNWQLRGAAVLAAKWAGAKRVIPALCYINAAECAEHVRDGREYQGRWEVGAPLDADALARIEEEMRGYLEAHQKARSDGDDEGLHFLRSDGGARQARRSVRDPRGGQEAQGSDGAMGGVPLILGPHCAHCPARGACPELARQALTLLRADGETEGAREGALTREGATRLAAILPAIRSAATAAEDALRAHVEAHGPIVFSDGREYGPALEPTESFEAVATFDLLAEHVGEDKARGAFTATAARIKDVLRGDAKRLPGGAWKGFVEALKKRGGVTEGVREVWRTRQPTKKVEG